MIEAMRARLLERGRLRDAALVVRARVRRAAAAGGARARVAPRARAHAAGRARAQRRRAEGRSRTAASRGRSSCSRRFATTSPPGGTRLRAAPTDPVFPSASGGFWRASDWRNWRKRIYRPVAESVGIDGARPYDLRHAFASLLIHEGRLSVVEIAAQLGHNPTVCLDTYAHVMAEQDGGEPIERRGADRGGSAGARARRGGRRRKLSLPGLE